MLIPAGFLVLMLFAAIAVDGAAAFLAQRQLTDALAAAANDAVTAGLDNPAYYSTGQIALDPTTSATVVCLSLRAQGDGDLHHLSVYMGLSGSAITIRGTAQVDTIFGRLISHLGTRTVTAQVGADAQRSATRSDGAATASAPLRC